MDAGPVGASARARAGSVALVVLVAIGVWAGYAGWRLDRHEGDPTWWVRAGEEFTVASELPEGFYRENGKGYDGQFYYRLARAPLSREPRVDGIELDRPAYRHQRLGYPLAAWLASGGGQSAAVPWTLPLVNLVAIGVVAGSVALLAKDQGRSPWWGLPAAFLPGLVVALTFDLAEATEAAAFAVALLLLRRQRFVAASAVMAYAALVRETSLLLPLGILAAAVLRWVLRRRGGHPAAGPPAWVAIAPVAVYGVTQVVMDRWWATRGGGINTSADQLHPPFRAILTELGSVADAPPQHAIALVAILSLGILGVIAVCLGYGERHEQISLVGATVLTSMLGVWDRAIVYLRYPTLWLLLSYVLLLSAPWSADARRRSRLAGGLLVILGITAVYVTGRFPIPSMVAGFTD